MTRERGEGEMGQGMGGGKISYKERGKIMSLNEAYRLVGRRQG